MRPLESKVYLVERWRVRNILISILSSIWDSSWKKTPIYEQGEQGEAHIIFNELMYKNPAPIFWPIFYKYSLSFSSPTHPKQRLVSFLPNPCVFPSGTHCWVIFPTPLISGWAMGPSSGQWNMCENKECLFWTRRPNHHLRFPRLSPPSAAAR